MTELNETAIAAVSAGRIVRPAPWEPPIIICPPPPPPELDLVVA